MDRSESSTLFGGAAVRAGGSATFELLLHSDGDRERGKPEADAKDRRAIPSASIFRISTDHGMVGGSGTEGEREACVAIDAVDGIAGSVAGTAHQSPAPTASSLSISSKGSEDPGPERSVVFRHHVYPNETGVSVLGGGHGLVQSLRAGLGAFQLVGDSILCGGAATISRQRSAGNLQHGPGFAIHQRRLHGVFGRCGDPDQHGWPGACNRQHLHRTTLAEREIRRHLSARLRRRDGNTTRPRSVLPLLQYRAQTSGAGKSDAGGSSRQALSLKNPPALISGRPSESSFGVCHDMGWSEIAASRASEGLDFFRSLREMGLRGQNSPSGSAGGAHPPPVASLPVTLQRPLILGGRKDKERRLTCKNL
jgi:hypothetical protein